MRTLQENWQRRQTTAFALVFTLALLLASSCFSGCAAVASNAGNNSSKEVKTSLTITTASLNPGSVGKTYSATLQATGGSGVYNWSLMAGTLPAGLQLEPSNGVISGTPSSAGTSSFTVQAADTGHHTTQKLLNASVNAATTGSLVIANSISSTATMGTAYASAVQVSGGTPPYTWSVSAGQLPPGLALNSLTGNISGIPTTSGAYSFTVKVTDSSSPQVSATSSSTVLVTAHPSRSLSVSGSILTSATVATGYSSIAQATGGTLPYTFSVAAGQLPTGLMLNSATGNISGTPSVAGTFNFTLKAADSSSPQQTAVSAVTISVVAPAVKTLSISGSLLGSGTTSTAYTSTAQATGGTLPYNWSVAAGQLPTGLTLNSATGNISGTPSVTGTFNFTLKVVDSNSPQQTASTSFTIIVSGVLFDQYGGFLTMPSPNPSTALFRTEKFGNKWMFVDPANNAFFMIGIFVFNEDQSVDNFGSSYYARTAAKYGDNGPLWATAQLKRAQSWGFNTSGPYASVYVLPTTVNASWATPDHTNPLKAPFVGFARPSYYSMLNQNNWSPQPVKDMFFGVSPYYSGFKPGDGIADYYDGNLQTFFTNELTDPAFVAIKGSAHKQYMIGMSVDDSDDTFGFGNGPDFRTGYSNTHLGWLVLTMSPLQTANSVKGFVYSDAIVYSKKVLHDQLVSKYGTIGALNSAWNSNYTTFDSSGSAISGVPIGTGDGSALTFTKTLQSPTISAFSLQILVAGQPVGGDTGKGLVFGPHLSGTISYTTGAVSLTFASGHAPPSAAPITASYVQNGWGIGTGLMDEDGRTGHQAWVGVDYTFMTDVNVSLKADLNSYLYQIAAHYFSMCKSVVQTWIPGLMYFGPSSLGTWGAPSDSNVLKAAAQNIDVMIMGGNGTALTQPMLDFIYTYYGDKPFYFGEYRTANSDSALFSYPDSGAFSTQQSRGQNYLNTVMTYPTASYTANGTRPYVGVLWWQYLDNWGEKLNWGLVSLMDNAYDGHESVTGTGGVAVRTVPCSPPLELYQCGGEQKNYGDVITPITQAHQQVMQAVQH
jgi:putative Ig domain-containing protein